MIKEFYYGICITSPAIQEREIHHCLYLSKIFQWARSVNPDQPISAGLWAWDLENLNKFQVANSDIITYHNYDEAPAHERVIQILKSIGRPLICTEYMARPT